MFDLFGREQPVASLNWRVHYTNFSRHGFRMNSIQLIVDQPPRVGAR